MRNKIFSVASLLIIASMVLAACAQPQTVSETVVETVEVEVVKTVEIEKEGQTVIVTATPEPEMEASFNSADPTTFVQAQFGEPDTLDPAFNYETSGNTIIMNVYDTVIFYNKDQAGEFVPQLALEVPTKDNGGISEDGTVYTFNIRSGVMFHDGTEMKASDIAYSWQHGILQGSYDSPQWLLTEPFLGVGVHDISEIVGDGSAAGDAEALLAMSAEDLLAACEQVVNAIVADDDAGTLTVTLAQAWAPFLATVAQGWSSAQSKAWLQSKGAWDGDCATWQNYYDPGPEKLNELGLGTEAMGTGPYKLERWVQGEEIVLVANEDYWRTEPAWEGGPTGAPALKTVIIKSITEFSTRYAMLLAGDADVAGVGSSADWPQMDAITGQICQKTDADCEPTDNPDGTLELIVGNPQSARTDIFMNYELDTTGGNNFMGSGQLDGNGIPPNFFSNVHVRKAFAYCFNYDLYLSDVLLGEGTRSPTVMLPGMPGYDENAPQYTYDPAMCEEEMKQAEFDGVSVWDAGFRLTIGYNTGNTQRQTVGEILQAELSAVNENFVIEVTGLPWPTYLRNLRAKKLPIFVTGWLEDIHDPHNWTVPYTTSTYGLRQNLPADVIALYDDINTRGVSEPDPAKRAEIYAEFNQVWYDNIHTILLFVTNTRRYQQRWVEGWYNNMVYPGTYYYVISKQ